MVTAADVPRGAQEVTDLVELWEALLEYHQRRPVIYAVAAAVFAFGAVAGGAAVGYLDAADASELSSYLRGYVAQAAASPGTLAGVPAPGAAVEAVGRGALLPFVLGLSVIGAPLVLALLFLRGFALGFTAAFLVREYSYAGILLAAASIVPQSLLAVPAALLAAGSSLAFALAAAKIMLGRRGEGTALFHGLVAFSGVAAAGALLAAAAWVQGAVTPVLVELVARYVPL